ncbi:hypothetical protein [Methanobacterium sp. MBAC-LM]
MINDYNLDSMISQLKHEPSQPKIFENVFQGFLKENTRQINTHNMTKEEF